MLHNVTEPGTLTFAQAPHEPTGFLVRATVLMEAGKRLQQWTHEILAEPAGWPVLQLAQVQHMADNREESE